MFHLPPVHRPSLLAPVRGGFALVAALLVAALALATPAAFAYQDAGTPEPGVTGAENPTVRVVNASPDLSAVTVLLDDQPIAENVASGAATEYAPAEFGDHRVQVVPAEGGNPLIDQTVTLDGGAAYILAVVGASDAVQLQVNQVDLNPLAADQSRFRVVNAIPGAPAIDVGVTGPASPPVEGIAFPEMSGYQDVPAGSYEVTSRFTEGGAEVSPTATLELAGGMVYDVFVMGQADQPATLLSVATQVASSCGEVLGIGEPGQSCLRIVHAAQDAGAVDVYVGEAAVAEGLEYGNATEFLAAPGGQQQLRVVPAGGSLSQPAVDATEDLGNGRAYQMTIATAQGGDQAAADAQVDAAATNAALGAGVGTVPAEAGTDAGATAADMGITEWLSGVDLSPLPPNQARVRVVHASPDTGPIDVAVPGAEVPFAGINFGTQSGYVAFDAGSYTFQLRLADTDTLLIETPEVDLQPGMIYDVYAIGRSVDGTLQVVVLSTEVGVQQGAVAEATPAATPAAPGAETATPVIAVGSTPVVTTPGAATPASTPSM